MKKIYPFLLVLLFCSNGFGQGNIKYNFKYKITYELTCKIDSANLEDERSEYGYERSQGQSQNVSIDPEVQKKLAEVFSKRLEKMNNQIELQ